MNLILVVLAAALGGTRAYCKAGVAGRCHSRRTLVEGFHVCDQIAVDRHHDILYMQFKSNMNTMFFLEDMKIRLVQSLYTLGWTVDQEEHVLYTADHTNTVFRHKPGSNITQEALHKLTRAEADLLFYKDVLYYTKKCCKGLYFNKKDKSSWGFDYLSVHNITDFVLDADEKIYFVANSTIYTLPTWAHTPEVVTQNQYVLSVDNKVSLLGGIFLLGLMYHYT